MVPLGNLDDEHPVTYATGVSGDGSVVVGRGFTDLGQEAFRWTSSTGMVGLGDLDGGAHWSRATAISDDGTTVVGAGYPTFGQEAFRWTEDEGMISLGDLPGGSREAIANAVSANGSVIVGYGTTSRGEEAFRWTEDGGMVSLGGLSEGLTDQLGRPALILSDATEVSADGSIVLGRSYDGTAHVPFIWDSANGMRDLNDFMVELGLDLPGWTLSSVQDISADGLTLIGGGTDPDGNGQIWIATIPEPSTALLVGIGLIGLSGRRPRRKLTRAASAATPSDDDD